MGIDTARLRSVTAREITSSAVGDGFDRRSGRHPARWTDEDFKRRLKSEGSPGRDSISATRRLLVAMLLSRAGRALTDQDAATSLDLVWRMVEAPRGPAPLGIPR